MKINLPVLVLKGIVLLPNNEIKIEFNNDVSRNIVDVSEMFHDNKVLIVSQENILEEKINIDDLPKIGIIGQIKNKIILPNSKVRITINGIARATVLKYLSHHSEVLEAIVDEIKSVSENVEAIVFKLKKEFNLYVKTLPYISNYLINKVNMAKDLDILTDLIEPILAIDLNRILEYLKTVDPIKRSEMILEDIYKEKEMFKIENEIDTKVRRTIDTSQKEFILREKIRAIKEELGDDDQELDELLNKINNLKCPENIKKRLKLEYKKLQNLSFASPEVSIIRSYIEFILDIPWNKLTKDNNDLKLAKEKLDENHYGLVDVKTRIIEFLAVKKQTKSLSGKVICFVGPPGVGKTSLAKSIANAMNRKFVKISLGGVNDTAEIIGHRKTYVGAEPGRILREIKKSGSMNPVFLIDEIDKLSRSIQGDPASALLEVLDGEQNKNFMDNYLEEEVDLSNVLFIVTANYLDEIPYALRDRLEIVELFGYTDGEKLSIAKKHLLPTLCKENGIQLLTIKDEDILYIIRSYTREAGVRSLNRKIDTIIRKVVTNNLLDDKKIKIINKKVIDEFLKTPYVCFKPKERVGVVNGLAYTMYGGDVLSIEVTFYKGNGKLTLTGSLGEVMKESAYIALSYLKANYKYFNIKYEDLVDNDIHIHVPEGAVPKDGPSAGITLTTALVSAFTNKTIKSDIAMTGEMTLRGDILPIGGLKEKSIGACRSNIKKVFVPDDNKKDVKNIPKEITDKLVYVFVKDYKEMKKYLFSETNI